MNAVEDIRERAEYYRVRAHRTMRSHYLTAKHCSRMHTSLGMPVVVISTVVGSTIFATLSEQPAVGWKIATGMLSIAAAVLAALQTFFKFSELAEKHSSVGAEYASIKRRFNSLYLRFAETDVSRDAYLDEMDLIIQDLDQLGKESPDVPDRFYDQAVKEQKSDEDGV